MNRNARLVSVGMSIGVLGVSVAIGFGLSTAAAQNAPIQLYPHEQPPVQMAPTVPDRASGTPQVSPIAQTLEAVPPRPERTRSGPSLILRSPDVFGDATETGSAQPSITTPGRSASDEMTGGQNDLQSIVRGGLGNGNSASGDTARPRRLAPIPPQTPEASAPEGSPPEGSSPDSSPQVGSGDGGTGDEDGMSRDLAPDLARAPAPGPVIRELPPLANDQARPELRASGSTGSFAGAPRRAERPTVTEPGFRSLFGQPETGVPELALGETAVDGSVASRFDRGPEVQSEFRSRVMPTPATTAAGHMYSSRDAASFVAWLPPNRRSGSAALVFSMHNSADVLPGSSEVGVFVNGEHVGDIGTTADGRGRRLAISLPERFVHDGYNTIEFRSSLFHRVACTVESGYDTWVQVPADEAYIGYDLENGLDHTAVLGWIGQAMQGRPLPIYSPERQPQDTIIRAGFSFAQGVSVSTGIEAHPIVSHPISDLQSENPSERVPEFPGLDLRRVNGPIAVVMGTARDLRGIVGAPLLDRVDGPHLSTHQIADRIIILISGLNGSDIAYAAHGFAEEVAQDQPPWRYFSTIRQNMSRDWATLGGHTESAYGPLYRSRVAVNLPVDATTTREQSARMFLNLAYGPGLAEGAELLILVNGRTAAAYPLSDREGDLLENRPVDLPMRYFRPGANLIELEARLPYVDEGQDCFWRGGPPTEGRPRLTFFEDTRIEFPGFGDTTLLPDLRLFTEEMIPYASSGRMPMILTSGDHDTVSAAWSFMGALAARSGRVLPVDLQIGGEPSPRNDAVVFGISRELPANVLERGTEDLQAVVTRWRTNSEPADVDWLPPDQRPRPIPVPQTAPGEDTDSVVQSLRRLQVSEGGSRSGFTETDLGGGMSLARVDGGNSSGNRYFTNGDRSVLSINGSQPIRAVDQTALERADWRNRLSTDDDNHFGFVGWLERASNTLISEAYTSSTDYRMPVWAESDRRDPQVRRGGNFVISQFSPRSWIETLPGVSPSTWTVISAPTTSGLWAGVERLQRIDSINGVAGDTALFDLPDGEISVRKTTGDYVFTGHQGFSISLFRSVLGQWFSINVGVWLAFVIGAVIIVGLITNSLLKSVGQREDIR